jgi:hypothetical protein
MAEKVEEHYKVKPIIYTGEVLRRFS